MPGSASGSVQLASGAAGSGGEECCRQGPVVTGSKWLDT